MTARAARACGPGPRWWLPGALAAVLAGLLLGPAVLLAVPGPAAAAPPADGRSVVAVVRSDWPSLPEPAPPEAELRYPQVRALVAQAVRLGGLESVLRAAETGAGDTLRVVLKVNIVHPTPNPGDITDWRVAKAVIEAAHALSPSARFTIAEGGVWLPPERTDLIAQLPFIEVADGFARAGYRPLLSDPDLAGFRLEIVDLNYDAIVETPTPGGGLALPSFSLPRTIAAADVLIDVPVMKITGVVGMTVAMKNLIGIAPGLVYGWSKSQGFPPGGGRAGLWHSAETLDETIVDLASVAGVDFSVVDALVAMEKARIQADGGNPVRLNAVVAGADVVAVDAVCTRLMGMNPADMEFITLAERRGLGRGRADRIEVVGQPLSQVARRFEKCPRDWSQEGHYGQGNRIWILRGPVPLDQDIGPDLADAPMAGAGGWSQPVYFHDDRIDLDRYFGNPANCVAYAYAEFAAPAAAAHLWLGSDEGLQVWLNGDPVYQFEGVRRHQLPCDRVPVTVRAGRNTVRVRVTQRRGDFDFSLKVCEPETDPRYDGNALADLEWSVPAPPGMRVREQRVASGTGERPDWWADQSVDHTQPGRVWISSYLPAPSLSPWVGLDEPLRWGWAMAVTARLEDDGTVHLTTENLRRCHLRPAGPLAEVAGPLTVVVDGARLEPVAVGPGQRLAVSAVADSAGAVTAWRAEAREANGEESPLAVAPARLSRSEAPEGHLDTPLGNWFTDAVRWATGADAVFQNNEGIRTDLEAGPVEVTHFFAMNFPDAIYQFQLTGQELLAALEYGLRDASERPLQVSGLEYEYDPRRLEGQRLVRTGIDPARTYTVVSEDYLCERGERFFGRAVQHRETGLHVVDCLVRYAAERGTVTSPGTGRIRQVRP